MKDQYCLFLLPLVFIFLGFVVPLEAVHKEHFGVKPRNICPSVEFCIGLRRHTCHHSRGQGACGQCRHGYREGDLWMTDAVTQIMQQKCYKIREQEANLQVAREVAEQLRANDISKIIESIDFSQDLDTLGLNSGKEDSSHDLSSNSLHDSIPNENAHIVTTETNLPSEGTNKEEHAPHDALMQKRVQIEQSLSHPEAAVDTSGKGTNTIGSLSQTAFISIVAACAVIAVFGLATTGICFYRLHKQLKATSEATYPAYGVTRPAPDEVPTSGDRKLAQSAQMFHYMHSKQQMIAMERAGTVTKEEDSDHDCEEECPEGDYTVYECPGLAPTGEMEVMNPLFSDESAEMADDSVLPSVTPADKRDS